jgi:hypothetical protein
MTNKQCHYLPIIPIISVSQERVEKQSRWGFSLQTLVWVPPPVFFFFFQLYGFRKTQNMTYILTKEQSPSWSHLAAQA